MGLDEMLDKAITEILGRPLQPKHALWIKIEDGYDLYSCSRCTNIVGEKEAYHDRICCHCNSTIDGVLELNGVFKAQD